MDISDILIGAKKIPVSVKTKKSLHSNKDHNNNLESPFSFNVLVVVTPFKSQFCLQVSVITMVTFLITRCQAGSGGGASGCGVWPSLLGSDWPLSDSSGILATG